MSIFFSIFGTVLGLAAFYVGAKLTIWYEGVADHQIILWLILFLTTILPILGMILYRTLPNFIARFSFIYWITAMTMGAFFCLWFYTAAADAALAFGGLFVQSQMNLPTWFPFAFAAVVSGTILIGAVQAALGPKVYVIDVPIKGLHSDLIGFKIAQISDLHIGALIGKKYSEKVTALANSLGADLMALTGDIIDGPPEILKEALEPLSKLAAKYGVFYVSGNHEFYWDIGKGLAALENMKFNILNNSHSVVRQGAAELVVAGISDFYGDMKKALSGANDNSCKVLLAHQPRAFAEAARAGVHLQLSGHTHGGQFFPWNLIVAVAQKYHRGLNKHENTWIYVNRGTGYWGPPIRFAIPAEITLLRLRADNSV